MSAEVYTKLAEGFELLAAGYRSLAEQERRPPPPRPRSRPRKRISPSPSSRSAKSDEGKTAQVKALLMKYDAGKLSGVKPEDYPDLLREVEAL